MQRQFKFWQHFLSYNIGTMGVVRTAPNAVVNAPSHLGGMGQASIYENQTIDHDITMHNHAATWTYRNGDW